MKPTTRITKNIRSVGTSIVFLKKKVMRQGLISFSHPMALVFNAKTLMCAKMVVIVVFHQRNTVNRLSKTHDKLFRKFSNHDPIFYF